MKWTLILFILFALSCTHVTSRGPSAESIYKHVVFDIDWTLVNEIKHPTPSMLSNTRVIEVAGIHYYVNEGLEEFFEDLRSKKDIKVSFFSGGKHLRNTELLSKIKLKDGKSLKDLAYKILSQEDLVIVENAPVGARFAERFKKDLTKVTKELDQLIMFDDTPNFVLENSDNQNNHVFFIGKAFEYFETYTEASKISGEYVPKSYEQWLLNKKKLNILNVAFNEAYFEASENGISFSEVMKKKEDLLNLKSHEWNAYSSSTFKKFQGILFQESKASAQDCYQLTKPLLNIQ